MTDIILNYKSRNYYNYSALINSYISDLLPQQVDFAYYELIGDNYFGVNAVLWREFTSPDLTPALNGQLSILATTHLPLLTK